MSVKLPEYVTIEEAARRYHVTEEVLTQLVESGKIRAIRIDGRVAVEAQGISTVMELWEQVVHLDGQLITINCARSKYRVGSATLYSWIRKGIVRVIQRVGNGKRAVLLNEADVAYAMRVAALRQVIRGRKTFTPEFLPPHMQMNPDR